MKITAFKAPHIKAVKLYISIGHDSKYNVWLRKPGWYHDKMYYTFISEVYYGNYGMLLEEVSKETLKVLFGASIEKIIPRDHSHIISVLVHPLIHSFKNYMRKDLTEVKLTTPAERGAI